MQWLSLYAQGLFIWKILKMWQMLQMVYATLYHIESSILAITFCS